MLIMEMSAVCDFMINFCQLSPEKSGKRQKLQEYWLHFGLFWLYFDIAVIRKLAFEGQEILHLLKSNDIHNT